jgi:hypothetical protein
MIRKKVLFEVGKFLFIGVYYGLDQLQKNGVCLRKKLISYYSRRKLLLRC